MSDATTEVPQEAAKASPFQPNTTKVLAGIAFVIAGAFAGYQVTFTGPSAATAAVTPAAPFVQYVPPKVEMLSKSDVQVLVDQTAKATVEEVMVRVDSMRAADMLLLNTKLDSIEEKVKNLGPTIKAAPRTR